VTTNLEEQKSSRVCQVRFLGHPPHGKLAALEQETVVASLLRCVRTEATKQCPGHEIDDLVLVQRLARHLRVRMGNSLARCVCVGPTARRPGFLTSRKVFRATSNEKRKYRFAWRVLHKPSAETPSRRGWTGGDTARGHRRWLAVVSPAPDPRSDSKKPVGRRSEPRFWFVRQPGREAVDLPLEMRRSRPSLSVMTPARGPGCYARAGPIISRPGPTHPPRPCARTARPCRREPPRRARPGCRARHRSLPCP
jgi:hypothetical protein